MKSVIVHTLHGYDVLSIGPECDTYHLPSLELARLAFRATNSPQGVVTVTTITDDGETCETFDLINH